MDLLSYQRTVFAFHGCDKSVADAVLAGKLKLVASENAYDWLGHGIYFWEHGPARAFEWARQQAARKGSKIKTPTVIGAILTLTNCLDLLDVQATELLSGATEMLIASLDRQGRTLPKNQATAAGDYDWLKRHRDCFVLNSVIPAIETAETRIIQSVRGVFQEGAPAFPGAGIKKKSHIQIAVRDPRAIIGYFRPEGF